jgi:uncharacterized metal-binding protein YceD (DUF177 family)
MAKESFPYSFKVNAAKVVDKDLALVVDPVSAELKAIAGNYDIDSIESLKADFILKPYRKAGLRIKGPLRVAMTRTCVVSLEPFESVLKLDVDRTFEPGSSRPRKIKDLNDDGEIEIELETLDPPDVILDGVLDLGAVICEELALSLDPFPRKPGIEFESGDEEGADAAEERETKPSPFAALKVLKGRPEE